VPDRNTVPAVMKGMVYMDLRQLNKYQDNAFVQFAPPDCYELSGTVLKLIMDDGYDVTLRFTDRKRLEWLSHNGVDRTPSQADYICLKGDDTTYLVSFVLEGVTPAVCHTFIIDMANSLVTRVICALGENPRYPRLIKPKFEFGAIASDRADVKVYPRHGFTSDMIGNLVHWTYGTNMTSVHAYYCANFYRIGFPADSTGAVGAPEMDVSLTEMMSILPSTDDPAAYIKIKEGMYVTCLTEANSEKLIGSKMSIHSSNLVLLQNYNNCYEAGRVFGTVTPPEGEIVSHFKMGAYAHIIDADNDEYKKMLYGKNPYIV